MKQKVKGKGSRGILILIGLCLLLSVGSALICAKMILSDILDQNAIPIYAAVIAALLSFVIGLYTAKRSPARKLLWGLIACGALFLSLLIGNLLFFGIRFYNVPTIAAGVIVGGVCGVILGKRKVRKFA